MNDWTPIHDWNAGNSARLLTRRMIWRQRFDRLRKWGWPIGTGMAVIALYLHGKGVL